MAIKELIESRISRAINERVFPACVVGAVNKRGEKLVLPFGRSTYEENSPQVTNDTIFDVASITKAIPTSSLALKLIDEGKLQLESGLIDYLPEFEGSHREEILIRHLLTLGLEFKLNNLSSYKNEAPDKILERILKAGLASPPGNTFLYTNSSSILLGLVTEKITKNTLDKTAAKYFFKPLKMERTTFSPLKRFNKDAIAPSEIDDWRGLVQGEVHDESTCALMKSDKTFGSAGLFSPVPDLLNFLEMLLNEGTLNGKRYFSPGIIKLMHTNQVEELGACHGLGWELYQPQYMGQYCTKETFGKTGFTGCVVICDIGKGIGMAMLSNTTYPKRKPLQEHVALINAVRRDIADIIFS